MRLEWRTANFTDGYRVYLREHRAWMNPTMRQIYKTHKLPGASGWQKR